MPWMNTDFFKMFNNVISSEKRVLLISSELACCQLGLGHFSLKILNPRKSVGNIGGGVKEKSRQI